MRHNRATRQAVHPALPIAVFGIAAALTMAGCAPAPTSGAPAPAAASQALTGLQGVNAGTSASDLFSVVNAPRMDAGSIFTGQILTGARAGADPTISVQVYDAPGGAPLTWLDHSMALPVVGHATGNAPSGVHATTGGWTRIMLPSRRSLPSKTPADLLPYINQGTGWVWDADVATTTIDTRILVNKMEGSVTLFALDNAWHETFPAVIGANVPVGPTFIASPVYPPAPCGDLSLTLMAAQGTNADVLPRQDEAVNPTAIAGPSDHCIAEGGKDLTDALSNMVRLTPADAKELDSLIVPGTPIDVVSADMAPDGTANGAVKSQFAGVLNAATAFTGQITGPLFAAFAKADQR